MYVDSSPGTLFDTTELHTPTIKLSGGNCRMKFYYHMYGTDLDVLTVYSEANNYRRMLWYRIGGTYEDKWKKEEVYIGAVNNFKVRHSRPLLSLKGDNNNGLLYSAHICHS